MKRKGEKWMLRFVMHEPFPRNVTHRSAFLEIKSH